MGNFELLRGICDNKEARKLIDDFIVKYQKEYNSDFRSSQYNERSDFFEKVLAEYYLLKRDLINNHSMDSSALNLYFSFDKILYPELKYYANGVFEDFIRVRKTSQRDECKDFNGTNIENIYSHDWDNAVNVFELNYQLFPPSTKNYLKRKIQEKENVSINVISNEFQARAFVSKFDEKFRITKFRDAVKTMSRSSKRSEFKKSSQLLHEAVHKRYNSRPENEVVLMEKFLSELVFSVYKGDNHLMTNINGDTLTLVEAFIDNQSWCNSFSNALIQLGITDDINVFAYFLCDDKHRIQYEKSLLEVLNTQTYNCILDFSSLPEQANLILLDSIKKQFLAKYKKAQKLLIKHGKVSEDIEALPLAS